MTAETTGYGKRSCLELLQWPKTYNLRRIGETLKCRAGGWVTRARGGRRVERATRRLWVELGCGRDGGKRKQEQTKGKREGGSGAG